METVKRVHNFFAFHGTDETSARNICDTGFKMPPQARADHWLGNGVYFYREDEDQALIWAEVKIKNIPNLEGLKAVVIETQISVCEDNFLNLDSRTHMELFNDFVEEVSATTESNNIQIVLSQNDDKVRHYFFELLPEIYYVIQRTFQVGSKFDNNPYLKKMCFRLHGVQICIRNLSAINGKPKITIQKDVQVSDRVKIKTNKHKKIRFCNS